MSEVITEEFLLSEMAAILRKIRDLEKQKTTLERKLILLREFREKGEVEGSA